jgi:pimeloyl-ACP methyl ester carboxylesterase
VSALVLVSTPMPAEPSERLAAAWEAEEAALERGDVDAAVQAVAEAWTRPGPTRERVAVMQRRAFELQLAAGELEDAPDPIDEDPSSLVRIDVPVLVMAGADDMPDFLAGADTLTKVLPGARSAVLEEAGHLVPLEAPDAFHDLVIGFLTLQ